MTTPVDPEQTLAQPVGGDLDRELRTAGKGVSKVTVGLGIAALVLLSFGGGALAHKAFASNGTPSATAGPRAGGYGGGFPGGYGGRAGQGGQNGQGGQPGAGGMGGRGGTAGTIDHVEGTTVYVKTQDGKVVKVSTSDSTVVDLVDVGKLADLAPGDTVVVQGQAGDDGSVTARTLTRRQAAG
ncbi:hypothetical protein V5P93_006282 [Actinokineospora auranticolor]|uniref:DUF5666 domain-containing protein n=1 Tax=Actinokineospora auranticolor TaxID=155976 RepID=A0A2S6GI32_9PSEU|nr:hypothetical protein [Actinokineospora auranticolor]PPK64879.1 hypothetical protein CLV40_117118 [Actinokineospora auranticolor]